MREIKFRAIYYLGNRKKALSKPFLLREIKSYHSERDGHELYVEGKRGEDVYIGYDSEFVQYTGLKDKNGKEIYEGYIILNGHERGVIIFENGMFLFSFCNDTKHIPLLHSEKYFKIIGNIHENPKLLE